MENSQAFRDGAKIYVILKDITAVTMPLLLTDNQKKTKD